MGKKQKPVAPSEEVISAFNLKGSPVLLAGGEGQSYRVADAVLKPVTEIVQTNWIAETLSSLNENGFRINRPIRAKNGEWIFNNWQAFSFVPGQHEKGRWREKIELSRLFHNCLVGIEKPDFIGKRKIPWEIADVAVWTDTEEFDERIRHVTDRLVTLKHPLQMQEQLIHGDMTGNILFHKHLPPAIIDFSPYWRPAEYATAIIIVDAIVWEGAEDAVISEMEDTFENNQLLIRATLWRIKTTEVFSKIFQSNPTAEIENYLRFIDLLKKRRME